MWCSSVIIIGYCCNVDLSIGQVECVTSDPVLVPLEVVNNRHCLILLKPLEVWCHGVLVPVLVSVVLMYVLVITVDIFL